MKPGEYQGYSSDMTSDAAMTAFLMKHPEEIGAKLEIHRDGGGILIRRKRGRQIWQHNREDVSGDDCGGDSSEPACAGDNEVTE